MGAGEEWTDEKREGREIGRWYEDMYKIKEVEKINKATKGGCQFDWRVPSVTKCNTQEGDFVEKVGSVGIQLLYKL